MFLTLAAHDGHPNLSKPPHARDPFPISLIRNWGGWDSGVCVSYMSQVSLMCHHVGSHLVKDADWFSKSQSPVCMWGQAAGHASRSCSCSCCWQDGHFPGSPFFPPLGREASASLIPFQHFPGFLSHLKRKAGCWQ